jgi:hypothetical protein
MFQKDINAPFEHLELTEEEITSFMMVSDNLREGFEKSRCYIYASYNIHDSSPSGRGIQKTIKVLSSTIDTFDGAERDQILQFLDYVRNKYGYNSFMIGKLNQFYDSPFGGNMTKKSGQLYLELVRWLCFN